MSQLNFQQPLFQTLVSHDPSKIIIIRWYFDVWKKSIKLPPPPPQFFTFFIRDTLFLSFNLYHFVCSSSAAHSPLSTQISCVLCEAPCVYVQFRTQWLTRVELVTCCVCCAIVRCLSLSPWNPESAHVVPHRGPRFECNGVVFLCRSSKVSTCAVIFARPC